MAAWQSLLTLAPHPVPLLRPLPLLLRALLIHIEDARYGELDAVEVGAHERPEAVQAGGARLRQLDHLPGRVH